MYMTPPPPQTLKVTSSETKIGNMPPPKFTHFWCRIYNYPPLTRYFVKGNINLIMPLDADKRAFKKFHDSQKRKFISKRAGGSTCSMPDILLQCHVLCQAEACLICFRILVQNLFFRMFYFHPLHFYRL